jgi:hypothetical protein
MKLELQGFLNPEKKKNEYPKGKRRSIEKLKNYIEIEQKIILKKQNKMVRKLSNDDEKL